jgi:hypothetical protein
MFGRQRHVFPGVGDILPNRYDRTDAVRPGLFQHLLPVRVKKRVADVGVGIDYGCFHRIL